MNNTQMIQGAQIVPTIKIGQDTLQTYASIMNALDKNQLTLLFNEVTGYIAIVDQDGSTLFEIGEED